jgi:GH25 family lysozyme M1 (1,4-beta-N-acetylmuramidase)
VHLRFRPARIALITLLVGVLGAPALLTSIQPAHAAVTTYSGPDVSNYQHPTSAKYPGGHPINWASVKKAGKAFAIVKATESTTYTNPYFKTDYAAAKAAGLVVGSYHFARPARPIVSTAQAQAAYFAKTIGDVTGNNLLPPALDLEVTGGLNPAQLVTWAQAFLYKLYALTGRVPMLYTYPNFWKVDLKNATAFSRFPLWMAAYGSSPVSTTDLWQYTDSSKISGISGGVDQSKYLSTGTVAWPTLSNAVGAVPLAWSSAAPNVPHHIVPTPGPKTATVAWYPGSDGSARTTSYTVTATPADETDADAPAPVSVGGGYTTATVTGLNPKLAYTFTVTATNAVGTSKPSLVSKPITPVVPTAIAPSLPTAVRYGKKATISAVLTRADNHAAVAKQDVTLYRKPAGATAWTKVDDFTTTSGGLVSDIVKPTKSVAYELVFSGAPGYLPVTVATKTLVVRPAVTATLSKLTVKHGHSVKLRGTVTPIVTGELITGEELVGGVWKAVGTTKVHSDGKFSLALKPTVKHKNREFRAVAAKSTARGSGASAAVPLTIT